jgi:hypothetical protein
MQSDTDPMVLQTLDSVLEVMCGFARGHLLLIELIRAPAVSQEAFAAAAQVVRTTLHSVDSLADQVHALSLEGRRL